MVRERFDRKVEIAVNRSHIKVCGDLGKPWGKLKHILVNRERWRIDVFNALYPQGVSSNRTSTLNEESNVPIGYL